nr:immunoglobulin heavy chain junction region [Macaca mulatta]
CTTLGWNKDRFDAW